MKANAKFVNDDEAVSPVIAVILMVAITVVLAATVFVLVQGIGGDTTVGPTAIITANSDNANDNITIQHGSGDTLVSQEYQISITLGASSNPDYETCIGDFGAGAQIAANTTTGGSATCTGGFIDGGTLLVAGTYRVVLLHVESSKVMMDQEVNIL